MYNCRCKLHKTFRLLSLSYFFFFFHHHLQNAEIYSISRIGGSRSPLDASVYARTILGGMYLPRSDSGRLLVGIWWLVVMVVVATYSGSLVAFLTFPNMDTAILTVEDLIAHRNKLTWGYPNGSYLEEYLKNAEEEKYHIMFERSVIHNVSQEMEMLERVKAGKHVLIDWRSTLR